MATQADVRRIARSLPGTVEAKDHFALRLNPENFFTSTAGNPS